MESSITKSLRAALILRFPEEYAALRQRLVVLPDTDGQRAWLVDLHDPFHPTAQGFPSMAAAEQAWSDRVYRALCSLATETVFELVA
jgi:hypothetical protein